MKLTLMGDRELFHHCAGAIDDLLEDFSSVRIQSYDRFSFLKCLNYHELPQELLTTLRHYREELESSGRISRDTETLSAISLVLTIIDELDRRVFAVTTQHVTAMKALGDLDALNTLVFMEGDDTLLGSLPDDLAQETLAEMRDYLFASVRLGLSDTSEVSAALERWCPQLLSMDLTDNSIRALVHRIQEANDDLMIDELFDEII